MLYVQKKAKNVRNDRFLSGRNKTPQEVKPVVIEMPSIIEEIVPEVIVVETPINVEVSTDETLVKEVIDVIETPVKKTKSKKNKVENE